VSISQNPFSGVSSPQAPRYDSHIRLGGRVGSPNVTKTANQPSPAQGEVGSDPHPAFSFSLWWEHWREARSRCSTGTPDRKHF
jgi:hypothetical protein